MKWDVGELPFIYKPLRSPRNDGLPEQLPFRLELDDELGHLVQVFDPYVESCLEKAYVQGSLISGVMDADGIGRKYAEDAISFILENYGGMIQGLRVLDIGCGTGYLLSRLQRFGADVLGVEPGAHGQKGPQHLGIPVIKDFFPSSHLSGQFDLITAFFVLEHLSDIKNFLLNVRKNLSKNGVLIVSVPDCGPYIERGDISFFFHEHWNYFTQESLQSVLTKLLQVEVTVTRSNFSGSLFALARLDKPVNTVNNINIASIAECSREELHCFKEKALRNIVVFQRFFSDSLHRGERVGVFVPGRAINLLSLNRSSIAFEHLQFFDDDKMLHGTFYPTIPVPIRSRESLFSDPPDRLLIMSDTFGEQIASSLIEAGFLGRVETVRTLFDLFDS